VCIFFVKQTKCVYCEVGIELLNAVDMNSGLQGLSSVLFLFIIDVRIPG